MNIPTDKKSIYIAAGVIILIALAAGGYVFLEPSSAPQVTDQQPSAEQKAPAPVAPRPSSPANTAVSQPKVTVAADYGVDISDFLFRSDYMEVRLNSRVTWTNFDLTSHTVVSDTKLFSSPKLSRNQKFEYIFTKAGTYTYHCSLHPSMKGTIIVR